MTPDDVRAAAARLTQFHQRFAPYFGKDEAQNHAYVYVKGLMTCPERKSIEPIALLFGGGRVSALQKFINSAPWDHDEIQTEVQEVFADDVVPAAASGGVGVVGVVDESGFTKKGNHSAGVDRQYNGRLGKEDNCQVGVFLVGVTPGGAALLDHQLYLPESWCEDNEAGRERRAKAHVPDTVSFQTKPQIAAGLVRHTVALDLVQLDWITADEVYGRNGEFLDELETLERRYVVEVPVTTTVWTEDPATCVPAYCGHGRVPSLPSRESVRSVVDVISDLEPGRWRRFWVLVRRSLEEKPEVKYYVSNGDEQTPLEVLAQVACTRHRVEEFFEDAKTYLGMSQYETRSWIGWHHHMSLVAMAYLFITLARLDLQKKAPELTLDRAVRLLVSALSLPKLSVEAAIELVNYYINRNRIARNSHMKSWMLKHGNWGEKFVPL
jgi:SRSO17 transposase